MTSTTLKSSSSLKQFWLIKAEPESRLEKGVDVKFSIDDLKVMGTSPWDGVRNYEARNILRDKMKLGDLCLFYHSNCARPGISGLARVCKEGYVDHTAFDPKNPYYDGKSDPKNPRWFMVDVEFIEKFQQVIYLKDLQLLVKEMGSAHPLSNMTLLTRGRLSVQPVTESEFDYILSMAGSKHGILKINK